MKRLLVAIGAVLAPVASAAAPPQETVQDFYRQEIRGPSNDGRLLGSVRHLLTRELDALLTATDTYQEACRRLAPKDVKPWIIDGDPWYYYSSDGARFIDATHVVATRGPAAVVAAELRYDDQLTWTDKITLVEVDGRWRIANIAFEQGGSLIRSLQDYIRYPCHRP
jgi:hypothetical protein